MSFNIRLEVDPVIICPYDPSHRIARSRIQRHLVKCEKNFPPGYKQQCPYDATHRVFEHEMVDHVAECPMKIVHHSGIIPDRADPEILEVHSEVENKTEQDEDVWDEGKEAATACPFDEPSFETIKIKQYTTVTCVRGNALIAKRYNAKLRRPFGYSESMMLDTSSPSIDEDAQSVSSDMGVGRGQDLLNSLYSQQHVRGGGVGRLYRRGFRGRLPH